MEKKNIYVDIDNTICETDGMDYENAVPKKDRIAMINKLADKGHTIIYWTARGTLSGQNWYNLTKTQLDDWGAKHTELKIGKPAFDILIDDKCINSLTDWSDERVDEVLYGKCLYVF